MLITCQCFHQCWLLLLQREGRSLLTLPQQWAGWGGQEERGQLLGINQRDAPCHPTSRPATDAQGSPSKGAEHQSARGVQWMIAFAQPFFSLLNFSLIYWAIFISSHKFSSLLFFQFYSAVKWGKWVSFGWLGWTHNVTHPLHHPNLQIIENWHFLNQI